MVEMLAPHYLILKSFHLIFMVCWMAALFYLPRLFAYHARVSPTGESGRLFEIMERRLVKIIMTPAMIGTWSFGILLLISTDLVYLKAGWMHGKFLCVLVLSAFHGISIGWMKKFARHQNVHSEVFFRKINEIPPIVFILIIFLVVLKPF